MRRGNEADGLESLSGPSSCSGRTRRRLPCRLSRCRRRRIRRPFSFRECGRARPASARRPAKRSPLGPRRRSTHDVRFQHHCPVNVVSSLFKGFVRELSTPMLATEGQILCVLDSQFPRNVIQNDRNDELQIQPEAALPDVEKVVAELLPARCLSGKIDLGQPGQARPNGMTFPITRDILDGPRVRVARGLPSRSAAGLAARRSSYRP